jgi:large subunit ribosomal protein L10
MPSQKNIEYVTKTTERLKDGKAFYFTDFTGLNVKTMEKLRKDLRANSGAYLVLKNTLGYLALKELGMSDTALQELFVGPTGIAIAFDDPLVLAKILTSTQNLKIKGGIIEGALFDATQVINFSKIPSRDVLLGTLVGSLNIIGNFVNVLESVLRNFIYTLEAMKRKEAQ